MAFTILLFAYLILVFFLFIWYLLLLIAYWKIFKKAGEKGWKALIPVYNIYIQYKISWDIRVFWAFFACLLGAAVSYYMKISTFSSVFSLIFYVFNILASFKLSRAFGHGLGFTIGLILLPPVFMLILAFGDSRYIGPET